LVLHNLPLEMRNVFELSTNQYLEIEEIAKLKNNRIKEIEQLFSDAKKVIQESFFSRYNIS